MRRVEITDELCPDGILEAPLKGDTWPLFCGASRWGSRRKRHNFLECSLNFSHYVFFKDIFNWIVSWDIAITCNCCKFQRFKVYFLFYLFLYKYLWKNKLLNRLREGAWTWMKRLYIHRPQKPRPRWPQSVVKRVACCQFWFVLHVSTRFPPLELPAERQELRMRIGNEDRQVPPWQDQMDDILFAYKI